MFNEKMNSVMKKSLYILAAFAAISFVSCEKEQEKKLEPIVEPAGTTLRASVNDGVDTKVSANPVGVFAWQASDKIAVLDNNGDAHEFTASSTGASSEFTCASSITLGAYAQYPYSASFAGAGNMLDFQIPATITYSADATNMPMLGKISGDVATFKAVGGLLKLIVYGVPAGATELEFAAKTKKISGGFDIADASVAEPVIVTAAKGTGDNIITIDFSGKYSSSMVFYIPLPTGTIDGFDLTFNDTKTTSISSSKNLTINRNDIIVAPAINMFTPEALFSETFTTDLTGSGDPATATIAAYNAEKKGQTVYGGQTVNYSINEVTGTKLYVGQKLAGGDEGEILLSKGGGVFNITGIPTAGASNAKLTFYVNNTTGTRSAVSSGTSGVTVSNRTASGSSAPFTISYDIAIENGVSTFDLAFTNSAANDNVRIDNISVSSAAPNPTIICSSSMRTINEATLSATSTVTGITLSSAIDGNGIGVSTSQSWLLASLSGTTLTITANSYNHTKTDRDGIVYLKATGATTKEITVTQKPTIVPAPSLTATPADKSFTLSFTPDSKAGSYVAYYSTTPDLADPTSGTTALTIDTSSNPYTATPSDELANGTKYYIYVRVNSVDGAYSEQYGAPTDNWATTNVTPGAAVTEKYTVISSTSAMEAGDYLMGGNNNNTFAGSTSFYLWAGTVNGTASRLNTTSAKTWDSKDKDFNNITGAATVTLEAEGTANVWYIKVGSKYLAASGTTMSLSDDPFAWTFANNSSPKEGMYFYNTTQSCYVYTNSGSTTALRSYNADRHGTSGSYMGVYFFKEK